MLQFYPTFCLANRFLTSATNEMLPCGPALEFIFAVDLWMLGHATKLYVDLVAEEVEELASREYELEGACRFGKITQV
jgi:hypothetical protein